MAASSATPGVVPDHAAEGVGQPAPMAKIGTISTGVCRRGGVSNGWAGTDVEKPAAELSILIAICDATGPRAIRCCPRRASLSQSVPSASGARPAIRGTGWPQ